MLADEDGDGLGSADRVFERRDPSQARPKRAAVEEGAEALGAEPAVQLRGSAAVAMGVAQKDIVGVAAPHRASLFFAARQSMPLIRLGGGHSLKARAAPRYESLASTPSTDQAAQKLAATKPA